MAQFQGFGYLSPAEITARTQAGFQKAMASGNKDQMRAAIAQQAAFALAGNQEVRDAQKRERILTSSFESAQKQQTGDSIQDSLNFYREVAKKAADAGLPDIAIQAAERLNSLVITQEERNRLRSEEERRDYRFGVEQEKDEAEAAKARLERRTNINRIAVNAYRDTIQQGGSELEAKQNARKAQLVYLTTQTEGGTFAEGSELANEEGIDLDVDSFNVNEAAAVSADQTPQLKGTVTIQGADGQPEFAYLMEGPRGPEIVPSGQVDARLKATLAGQNSRTGKITDSQRQAANYALSVNQAQQVFDQLEQEGAKFTGVWDNFEELYSNHWKDADRQKFEQATANFVQTYLRDVSGATIKGEEIVLDTKRFIPQPGDTPAMVAQKAANRRAYQAGLLAQAGSEAYSEARRYQMILDQAYDQRARLNATGF